MRAGRSNQLRRVAADADAPSARRAGRGRVGWQMAGQTRMDVEAARLYIG